MATESIKRVTHESPGGNEQISRLEEALRECERLALIGRITASVMHEINNPAEAITNLVFLIAQNAHDPDLVASLAAQVEEQMVRIQYVTRQTLSFFRTIPHRQVIDIVPLIETAIRFYEPSLRRQNIRVRKQLQRTVTAPVYPGDFLQMVSNLLSNAIDAVDVGGSLCIRLRSIRDGIRLTVSDNGCGIPRSLQSRLFEPFQTSKAEGGNGLGLWICRSVAEKHGGRVSWRSSTSERNHGTTFSVSIAS